MKKHHKDTTAAIIIVGLIAVILAGVVAYASRTPQNNAAAAPTAGGDSMAGHHQSQPRGTPKIALDSLVGKAAPDFSLRDSAGQEYTLDKLKGKKVVLFFNEGLMCYPACWNQIAALGADKRFKNKNVTALSVVIDAPAAWQRAVSRMPELNEAQVLFDTGGVVSRTYGMLEAASSMHYGVYPGHTYVVIDENGIVRHVFDDPAMSIHNDQLAAELAKL